MSSLFPRAFPPGGLEERVIRLTLALTLTLNFGDKNFRVKGKKTLQI